MQFLQQIVVYTCLSQTFNIFMRRHGWISTTVQLEGPKGKISNFQKKVCVWGNLIKMW